MNREQYISIRANNNILAVAYDYYITECDNPETIEMFNKAFPIFIMKTFNIINWNMLWYIYDNKFNITILQDVNGNNIKIY